MDISPLEIGKTNLFLNVITKRYEEGSIIVTSNLLVSHW
ncbi:hypothetical protein BTN49_3177 [Candidatus Enterovibrio escicola]|uniref:IstB-like ATP-binding domain-containing protein n=1 Tax=Candidatus Enterovibrio escicola TaxID=1927127 RepID=A0A2A5SZD9_9GAMM|nr:hypothetical protein BTN49_3177 [Candidatus Enterovibrio escacola]